MKKLEFIFLISILAIGGFLRLYRITEVPLGLYPDEAMNGNNALEAIATSHFKIFYPENNGREGLFINLQAISVWIFGNQPWALRIVSALFGTLTILGVYLVTKELFGNNSQFSINFQSIFNGSIFKRLKIENCIALFASFFIATSYWHLNFSRIGFRAIMVPFFSTFGFYFLLKGLHSTVPNLVRYMYRTKFGTNSIIYITLAGIFIGLGFHTYIAFRFMPFICAVPLIFYFIQWKRSSTPDKSKKNCAPCAILLFLFVVCIVGLPLGYYFIQNPQDFAGRGAQVSIFSAASPLKEFAKSAFLTLQMFFYKGDCNWRHNFNCEPQLYFLTVFFFLIGLITVFSHYGGSTSIIIITWLIAMALPAILTREGLPHALRAIGMIPPIMILSGLGASVFFEKILAWLEKQKEKWSSYRAQLQRLQTESIILFITVLLLIPLAAYRTYFLKWAHNPETYAAFSTDFLHLGQFLNGAPPNIAKYVVVNLPGTQVRGIPMPAQTVMFITDTFREEKQTLKNIFYRTTIDQIPDFLPPGKTIIAVLNGADRESIRALQKKYPEFRVRIPGDFIILQNYQP